MRSLTHAQLKELAGLCGGFAVLVLVASFVASNPFLHGGALSASVDCAGNFGSCSDPSNPNLLLTSVPGVVSSGGSPLLSWSSALGSTQVQDSVTDISCFSAATCGAVTPLNIGTVATPTTFISFTNGSSNYTITTGTTHAMYIWIPGSTCWGNAAGTCNSILQTMGPAASLAFEKVFSIAGVNYLLDTYAGASPALLYKWMASCNSGAGGFGDGTTCGSVYQSIFIGVTGYSPASFVDNNGTTYLAIPSTGGQNSGTVYVYKWQVAGGASCPGAGVKAGFGNGTTCATSAANNSYQAMVTNLFPTSANYFTQGGYSYLFVGDQNGASSGANSFVYQWQPAGGTSCPGAGANPGFGSGTTCATAATNNSYQTIFTSNPSSGETLSFGGSLYLAIPEYALPKVYIFKWTVAAGCPSQGGWGNGTACTTGATNIYQQINEPALGATYANFLTIGSAAYLFVPPSYMYKWTASGPNCPNSGTSGGFGDGSTGCTQGETDHVFQNMGANVHTIKNFITPSGGFFVDSFLGGSAWVLNTYKDITQPCFGNSTLCGTPLQTVTRAGATTGDFIKPAGTPDTYLALANGYPQTGTYFSPLYKWQAGNNCFGDGTTCGTPYQKLLHLKAGEDSTSGFGFKNWKSWTIGGTTYAATQAPFTGTPIYKWMATGAATCAGVCGGIGSSGGLRGQYYNNISMTGTPVLTRTEAVNFAWGGASPGAPVNATNWTARWSGTVVAPVTGSYTFTTNTDDGARLWVNGVEGIDQWSGPSVSTYVVSLTAGQQVPIIMDYTQAAGASYTVLSWSYPGQVTTPIPASSLYAVGPAGSGCLGDGSSCNVPLQTLVIPPWNSNASGLSDLEFYNIGATSYLVQTEYAYGNSFEGVGPNPTATYVWMSGAPGPCFGNGTVCDTPQQTIDAYNTLDLEPFSIGASTYMWQSNNYNQPGSTGLVADKLLQWTTGGTCPTGGGWGDGTVCRGSSAGVLQSISYWWGSSAKTFTIPSDTNTYAVLSGSDSSATPEYTYLLKWLSGSNCFGTGTVSCGLPINTLTSTGGPASDLKVVTSGGSSYILAANGSATRVYKWMSVTPCLGDGSTCNTVFQTLPASYLATTSISGSTYVATPTTGGVYQLSGGNGVIPGCLIYKNDSTGTSTVANADTGSNYSGGTMTEDTKFTESCLMADGSTQTASVLVRVQAPGATMSAAPVAVAKNGGASAVTWSSSNISSGSCYVNRVDPAGVYTTFSALGAGDSGSSVTTGKLTQAGTYSYAVNCASGSTKVAATTTVGVGTITASPSVATLSVTPTISWSNVGATGCAVTRNGVAYANSSGATDSYTVVGTYTYALTCAQYATSTAVVVSAGAPPGTLGSGANVFQVSPARLQKGKATSVTFKYKPTNMTTCSIDHGVGSGPVTPDGTLVSKVATVTIVQPTLFTLTCTDSSSVVTTQQITIGLVPTFQEI